jgi:hypothetical protein
LNDRYQEIETQLQTVCDYLDKIIDDLASIQYHQLQ